MLARIGAIRACIPANVAPTNGQLAVHFRFWPPESNNAISAGTSAASGKPDKSRPGLDRRFWPVSGGDRPQDTLYGC
jgi:hypothetical protein